MEKYFEDLIFQVVVHRFIMYDTAFFRPEGNSLEFISDGHIILEREGESIELAAPVLFWMEEGLTYRFRLKEKNSICEHIYVDFSGARSERIIRSLETSCPAHMLHPQNSERVRELFFELLNDYRIAREEYHAKMVLIIETLMVLIHESLHPASLHPPTDVYGICLVAEQIRSDPFREFNVREMARRRGISCDHFRRLFRDTHELPIGTYIRNQRMLRAADLLRTTNMRIKEIMYACKFDTLMDFSRSFKSYSGMSPRAYRVGWNSSPRHEAMIRMK